LMEVDDVAPQGRTPARGTLERVLRRDRAVVVAGLVAIGMLAWAYTAYLAMDMSEMGMADGRAGGVVMTPQMRPWGLVDLFLTFIMWSVMMVAMMVPSAAPMVLLFAAIDRKRRETGSPLGRTAFFLLGYLLVWTTFSAGATAVQWGFHGASLLSPMMVSTSTGLGASLLVAAGLFQLTPLKTACLRHCRTPLHFFMGEWRDGKWGALAMGVKHGAYCVGCCWILMALLFVAGVMNLVWVAVITVFTLVERVAPGGEVIGRVAGMLLIAAGLALAAGVVPGS
jgi:predicted metal-binding membrane protein